MLTTTRPEAVAAALAWFTAPAAWLLQRLGLHANAVRASKELVLMFVLSLRFIDIVFVMARDIALGVATRGIRWSQLGFARTVGMVGALVERFFGSLFGASVSISEAMVARGFEPARLADGGGAAAMMESYTLTRLRFRPIDHAMTAALACVVFTVCARR